MISLISLKLHPCSFILRILLSGRVSRNYTPVHSSWEYYFLTEYQEITPLFIHLENIIFWQSIKKLHPCSLILRILLSDRVSRNYTPVNSSWEYYFLAEYQEITPLFIHLENITFWQSIKKLHPCSFILRILLSGRVPRNYTPVNSSWEYYFLAEYQEISWISQNHGAHHCCSSCDVTFYHSACIQQI